MLSEMEQVQEFEDLIDKTIHEAEVHLHISNRTMAYVLLREGLNHYLKSIYDEEKEHEISP